MNKPKLSATPKLQRLIPRAKVAFYLGVCTRTIARYEEKGLLSGHKINSRVISYPEHQVLKLIADARVSQEVAA